MKGAACQRVSPGLLASGPLVFLRNADMTAPVRTAVLAMCNTCVCMGATVGGLQLPLGRGRREDGWFVEGACVLQALVHTNLLGKKAYVSLCALPRTFSSSARVASSSAMYVRMPTLHGVARTTGSEYIFDGARLTGLPDREAVP